jgi:hypothetical protein
MRGLDLATHCIETVEAFSEIDTQRVQSRQICTDLKEVL